jgi:hypothetical protein
MDLEGQGSQKVSVTAKLKKSIPDEEQNAPTQVSRKVSKNELRKSPQSTSNKGSKYSSFKDSGKKRTSATPVSPKAQVVSLANSRSTTS